MMSSNIRDVAAMDSYVFAVPDGKMRSSRRIRASVIFRMSVATIVWRWFHG